MRAYEASLSAPPFYPGRVKKKAPPLNFPHHLAALRKERGLTQLALAGMVGMHILQIRHHENGQSQSTLDAIRKLAMALTLKAAVRRFAAADSGGSR